MSLKVKDVLTAHLAILDLIEADKTNKFVFASATRIKLAGNLRKTRPVFEEFTKEKDELIKRLGAPVEGKPDEVKVTEENQAKFVSEIEAMYEADSDVTLNPVDAKDLGENQLPIDLLANLETFGLLKL